MSDDLREYTISYGKYTGKKLKNICLVRLDKYLGILEENVKNNKPSQEKLKLMKTLTTYLKENSDELDILLEEKDDL